MNNPVCIHTISIVIVMMMVVMMHQCTSSALRPASSPCPPIPPTVELYSLMARGRRGGHKRILQSVGIPPLEQQPVTEAASLVADDGVQDVRRCPEEPAVWSKSSSLPLSPRSLASDPQQTCDT